MNAPDKIYLSYLIYGTQQYTVPDPDNDMEVEYIRKDALLEWAKEWQNELDDSLGASMVHHVLNEVIKKIKLL